MAVTNAQVRRLRAEMTEHGEVGRAAMGANMSRNTAAKFLKANKLPSEMKVKRDWRTREDPFEEDWAWIEEQLIESPGFEAKTLFEELTELHPDRYEPGQLRTLQRRIRRWRATKGPEKELHLPQDHRPGEAMQTDFTHMNSLGITIGLEPYDHLLCHCTLPYSNWSWGTPCRSESMAALRVGVAGACRELGHTPEWHQTDNSTSATHSLSSKKRDFNEDYLSLMETLDMKPRTIGVGKKEQNGDIEASNGVIKRHIEQKLLLRGHRDFDTLDEYRAWLKSVMRKRNSKRGDRLQEELSLMKPMTKATIAEFSEVSARVTSGGSITVKKRTYSLPSRLRGEQVRVRLYDERIEVYFAGECQLRTVRLRGNDYSRIDYRHIVPSLIRKCGGFRRYRHREHLFPTPVFRAAFDSLCRGMDDRKAEIEYLRILLLAAQTMESDVEAALKREMQAGTTLSADALRAIIQPIEAEIPPVVIPSADLSSYDELLSMPIEEVA